MITSNESLEAEFSMERARGGVIEEQPFRLLVIGDWAGGGKRREISQRRPIEIDRDNFDQVMARIAPEITVEIDGRSLALKFSELDDLHPDRIFQRVPLFSELRDLRRRLRNDDSFYEAAREVRSALDAGDASVEQTTPSPTTDIAPDDLLGQILSRPSGGAVPPSARKSGELDILVSELVRPFLVKVDENEQQQMLDAVDAASGDLMRKIIHDHGFRELEAAWRGLFFLARRAETGVDLKLFLLDLTKDELAADLKGASDLSETLAHEILMETNDEPWAAIAGNYGFLPNVDDVAALVRISKLGHDANAPFISHMRPEILGIHTLEGNTDPRNWNMSETTDAGKLWLALRSMPEARWLGMTIPRFLGRLPYGAESDPLENFGFEEFDAAPEHDKFVWINSCFAAALLLAQSFSVNGWELGQAFIQDIEKIPVHTYDAGGETVYTPCAEVQLTHEGADRLMTYGLMPLVSYKNTDHVRLERFQSITDPVSALRGRWK
ncbi:MAG TPA: type VI secretion system contractile sheath large subunit [Pyrinomonadaceae bacterium]|nr:type VI secretion system contractile sheath large subunit [Pyrinomonadaceae bacterium]